MGDLFDKISGAVFNTDRPRFDLGSQYYTILINMPGTNDLYQKVKGEISNKIADNAIAYAAYDQIKTPEALQDLFFQRANRWANQRKNHFVLLKTFTGDENSADEIKMVIDNIHLLSNDEKISLFLVIPFGKNECAKEINNVLKRVNAKKDVYVFTEKPQIFAKEILYESISGTIIMNSYFSYENDKSNRVNSAINKVNTYINAMGEGGKKYYYALPDFTWTTACCHFENSKDSFLYVYLYKLMGNMLPFEQELFDKYFESIDGEMNFGSRSTALLKQAYEKIPRIDSSCEEPEEFNDITQHFRSLFGDGGDHVVKTTINTTLYFNDRNAKPNYDFYAKDIFKKYIEYRSTLDYLDIRNIIDNYVVHLRDRYDDGSKELKKSRKMDDYLKGYVRIYAIKKKIDFWREIKFYIERDISIEGTDIYKLNQESIQNMETFNTLFQCCQVQTQAYPALANMINSPSSLSFNDIMKLSENSNECKKINEIYYNLNIQQAAVNLNMRSVFDLPILPNMYHEEAVSLSAMNLPYSIKGIEYNGKYWDCM